MPEFCIFDCSIHGPANIPNRFRVKTVNSKIEGVWNRLYTVLLNQHFRWDNFEFLRDGKAFNAVVNDLKSDIADKNAILERINKLSRIKWEQSVDYMQSLNYVMMQIYSTDLMLR